MGAECSKHGVDLHGTTFDGLTCPVCEADKRLARAESQRDHYREALEEILDRSNCQHAGPRVFCLGCRARQALSEGQGE